MKIKNEETKTDKSMGRQVIDNKIQMTTEHRKRCSALLVVIGTCIKITYHFLSTYSDN